MIKNIYQKLSYLNEVIKIIIKQIKDSLKLKNNKKILFFIHNIFNSNFIHFPIYIIYFLFQFLIIF